MADMTIIMARFALMALSLGLAGVPLYLRIAGQRAASRKLRIALAAGAVVAAMASMWWAAASVAAMAAVPLTDLDVATLLAVLDATPLGPVLELRLAASAALLVAVFVVPRNALLALIAAIGPVSGAWTGHAGAAEGLSGAIQRLSDAIHLLGAALWFGALLVFLASVSEREERPVLTARLERFARTGTAIVIALAVTGGLNVLLIARTGWEPASTWSLLLATKLVLFGAMLGLAGLNRWKLTPEYAADLPQAARRLRLSLTLETGCALAIFAIVAVLGLSDPTMQLV